MQGSLNLISISKPVNIYFVMLQCFLKPEILNSLKNSITLDGSLYCPRAHFYVVVSDWQRYCLSGGRCCTVLRPESSYLRRCVGDGLQGLMGKPACPHGLQCCPCVDTSFLPEPASAASINLDSSSGADSPLRDPWDLRLPHMTLKPPAEDVRATSSLHPGPLLQASHSTCMVPTVAWPTSSTFHCPSGFHL